MTEHSDQSAQRPTRSLPVPAHYARSERPAS